MIKYFSNDSLTTLITIIIPFAKTTMTLIFSDKMYLMKSRLTANLAASFACFAIILFFSTYLLIIDVMQTLTFSNKLHSTTSQLQMMKDVSVLVSQLR